MNYVDRFVNGKSETIFRKKMLASNKKNSEKNKNKK